MAVTSPTLAGKDRSLWIQDLDQNEPRSIAGTAGAQRPFWSPDSAFIAFALGGELMKTLSPVGLRFLSAVCRIQVLSWKLESGWRMDRFWSRGGANKGGLYRVAARGGTPRYGPGQLRTFQDPRDPYFLPIPARRAAFLFVANAVKEPVDRTWVHDLNTGKHHPLGGADGQFPTYSRSGHILYMRSQSGVQLWAAPFSLETLKITGESFPVADSRFRIRCLQQ